MNEEYKQIIKSLVINPENSFTGTSYKFGRKKSLNRLNAMVRITESYGIPESVAYEAMDYLDKEVKKRMDLDKERNSLDNRPDSWDEWRDGDQFPEFTEPEDFAKMLFLLLDVSTSGTLKYCKVRGIPKWISHVSPSMTVHSMVKEHDIKAGVAAEVRRYKRQRTDREKEAGHTFTIEEVLIHREAITNTMRINVQKEIAKNITFNKEIQKQGYAELMKFIKAYKPPNKCDESSRMHLVHFTMICHWIWQVKRKIKEMEIKYPVALIFLGRQGIGKSYCVEKLISFIEDLSTPANVSDLVDEKQSPRWEKYFIALLDEVSKETKDSLAKLKDWITKPYSEYRPLYSNSSEKCERNAQAIGTSNFPLASILKDSSGMRRFWEVPSEQPANVLFKGIDDIDWGLIFKAIDETNDNGYYGPLSIGKMYYKEIVEIQNNARDKSPLEEYLYVESKVDIQGRVVDSVKKEWVKLMDLLEEFNFWVEENGWRKFTPKYVRNELQNMHLEIKRRTGNREYVQLNVAEEMKSETYLNEKEIGFGE